MDPINYRWRYDTRYYRAVIDRYDRQRPWVLHLSVQFAVLWLLLLGISAAVNRGINIRTMIWWVLGGCVGIPLAISITKHGIMRKYRLRKSFGSEACYSMTQEGVAIHEASLNGSYPWSVYSRAIRFPDGLMLLRSGGIRWLPDESLSDGTASAATALVESHLPMRRLNRSRNQTPPAELHPGNTSSPSKG